MYREKCKTCIYRAALREKNGCDFYLITGQRRGCSPDDCFRYEEGEKVQLKGKIRAEIAAGYLRGTYPGGEEVIKYGRNKICRLQ